MRQIHLLSRDPSDQIACDATRSHAKATAMEIENGMPFRLVSRDYPFAVDAIGKNGAGTTYRYGIAAKAASQSLRIRAPVVSRFSVR